MKSVLLLIQHLWNGGGTETYVFTLAKALQRQGVRVGVFTQGGPWVAVLRRRGIPVYTSPRYREDPERLQQVVRTGRFGALHANDGPSIELIGRLRHRPPSVVMTVHGEYVGRSAVQLAGRLARTIIAVTPTLRRFLRSCGIPAAKIRMIHNAIDLSVFRPGGGGTLRARYGIPEAAFVIGYAGRFTLDKLAIGRRIAGGLKRFASGNPHVRVLIAGRQSRRQVVPGARFQVLGHVERMEQFYRACDVVIGTGRVAMEAMACGVPVIALGHAGYRGIVTPRNCAGLLRSNFGDHGAPNQLWRIESVVRDIYDIAGRRSEFRRQAGILRGWVAGRLSASVMARQIACYY